LSAFISSGETRLQILPALVREHFNAGSKLGAGTVIFLYVGQACSKEFDEALTLP
jgi:hypothetical protein